MSTAGSRRRLFRRVLRAVHAYAGLALSLILLVLGLSGSALVYKEAFWRLAYPELRQGTVEVSATEAAAAFDAARSHLGASVRSVKLPEPGVSAYHLYLEEGEAFISVGAHQLIDRWRPGERPMSLLFDLHAHLMAGRAGEVVGGITALLGVLMVVTGVVLWWPARRRFGFRALLPRGFSRQKLLASHRDLGMVTTPILLVLLLSGAGIVFYGTAGVILNGLFGDRSPPAEPVPGVPGSERGAQWAGVSLLRTVRSEFPDARLVFYYPPRDGGAHGFRLKRPCEVHPNGRSYLYTDATGAVLQRTDACASPPGQKALHSLYPLHAGKLASRVYKFIVFTGGLVLTLIAATGVASYLAKLSRYRVRA